MPDLYKYYKDMPDGQIMTEFNQLLAEWRTGRADGQVTNALSAIWREMKSRGNDLGRCEDYGDPKRNGYW